MKYRQDIVRFAPKGSVGAELGVATGQFSKKIMQIDHFEAFYAVDRWSDHHDNYEYEGAKRILEPFKKCTVVRQDAIEWCLEQEDESFGFIYIDCYAHTGQEGGSIIDAAWPKVQKGGILAGDDYETKYQPTVDAVDAFAEKHDLKLNIYDKHLNALLVPPPKQVWNKSKSWWVIKE